MRESGGGGSQLEYRSGMCLILSIGKIPPGFVILDGAECGREEEDGGSAETALVTVLNSRQPSLTQRLR